MKFTHLLSLAAGLAAAPALHAVPLTDLILYGQVYNHDGNRVTSDLTANSPNHPLITVKPAGANGTDDPAIATSAVLYPNHDPNLGEIYVLRIKRETGPVNTIENAVLAGTALHLYLDGVEVAETSADRLSASGSPLDVRLLHLNDTGESDPLEGWLDRFGLVGAQRDPASDHDHDGLTLFEEWVHNLDPSRPDQHPLDLSIVEIDGVRYVQLSFNRQRGIFGLTTEVETSLLLEPESWTADDQNVEPVDPPVDNGDGTERVAVRYRLDQAPQRFLRLLSSYQP